MRLPDPDTSMAVLIGCSRFEGMEPLPAVIHNISDLRDLLTDPQVWGLPMDRCVVLAEPRSPADIIDTINQAAQRATDTFLVYYAGHGLLDDLGQLHLGLGQTGDHKPHTALSYGYVRAAVKQRSMAELNIVVLDCCYSGGALKDLMGGGIGALSAVEGAYVLTSSAENEPSMAPPEEKYTAFSGELIRLLRDGLPGAGPALGFDDVFQHLSRELAAKHLPQPQQAVRNSAAGYAFAPNRAHSASSPPPARLRKRRTTARLRRRRRPLSPPARRYAIAGTLVLSLAAGAATFGVINGAYGDAATGRTAGSVPSGSVPSGSAAAAASGTPAPAGVPQAPAGPGGTGPGTVVAPIQPPAPHTTRTGSRNRDATAPASKRPATTSPATTAAATLDSPVLVIPPDEIVYTVPDTVNYGWQAVAGASGYLLETEATDGVNYQPVATHQTSGTQFSEPWPGWQKFRWRVVAVGTGGQRGRPSDWRHAYDNPNM
jgi:hypothetical protein